MEDRVKKPKQLIAARDRVDHMAHYNARLDLFSDHVRLLRHPY